MSEISFTEVICQTGKKTAVITLTRMSALNALSFDMLQQMQLWLHAWQQDDAIQGVIIHSETPAAFCAGGDLKALYHNMDMVNSAAIDYFELEYAIDRLIYHYSKPYIALMSGITMGGGVGVSLHGSHPVVFESTRLAMPESKIGFFVDAGESPSINSISVVELKRRVSSSVHLKLSKPAVPLRHVQCIIAAALLLRTHEGKPT